MNILITGATSGLGSSLAEAYSQDGNILFLTGRNQEKLERITQICQAKQAKVISKVIDIKDCKAIKSWIEQIGQEFDLNLVIANAGISAGTSSGLEGEQQIKEIFATNIDGVFNTINPAIALMLGQMQKQGADKNQMRQVAIMSSLAGFRGLPSSPAYSASKACVRVYGEGLRGSLAQLGIGVSVICPGYVKTPMTDTNDFPMPFLMSSGKAAQIIKKAIFRNKSRIAFPFPFYFIVWLATLVSTKITDPLFAKLPKKKSLAH